MFGASKVQTREGDRNDEGTDDALRDREFHAGRLYPPLPSWAGSASDWLGETERAGVVGHDSPVGIRMTPMSAVRRHPGRITASGSSFGSILG